MATINLLPWRLELRKQRQTQFLLSLAVAVVVTLVLIGVAHFWMDGVINNQKKRNAYLQGQIAVLNRQIQKISKLENTINRLKKRIDIIQTLQTARPEVVHLFDEIVKTLPNGVYLKQLIQKGNRIVLHGVAQSNARVSTYMWKLEGSDWLANPDLDIIQTKQARGIRSSNFVLRVMQARKQAKTNKKGGAGK